MKIATNYIFGWTSPRSAVWQKAPSESSEAVIFATMGGPRWPLYRVILLGLLYWFKLWLPYYERDANSRRFRVLAFHCNIIYGPYTCSYCNKATTNPDFIGESMTCCGRKVCQTKARQEIS